MERYKDRVHEWEIWNEPDGNHKGTAEVDAYIDLYIRTASIVREVQPTGKIYALALAGTYDYADKFLTGMTQRNKLDLIDALTIHGYPSNPDETHDAERIRQRIAQTGHAIGVREGETGAPSRFQPYFALSNKPFSETTQAKWDLRRMLAFRGMDIPVNLFTMMDMRYQRNGQIEMNYKGLLAAKDDSAAMAVAGPKPAYYATQNLFTIFDDSLELMKQAGLSAATSRPLALFAYSKKTTGAKVVALWFNDAKPVDSNQTEFVDLTLSGVRFKHPVYVDLLNGSVYALPKPRHGFVFSHMPVYDSPILIAEKSAIPIQAEKKQ